MTDDGIACWFCPVCKTLALLSKAVADECCETPRRATCPLPLKPLSFPRRGSKAPSGRGLWPR